jgi:hypothetical protein
MRNIRDNIDFEMFSKTFDVMSKHINTKIKLSFKSEIVNIMWVSDVEMNVGGTIKLKYYNAKYKNNHIK